MKRIKYILNIISNLLNKINDLFEKNSLKIIFWIGINIIILMILNTKFDKLKKFLESILKTQKDDIDLKLYILILVLIILILGSSYKITDKQIKKFLLVSSGFKFYQLKVESIF